MSESVTLGGAIRAKQHERDRLAQDVEAFVANGGSVEQLAPGQSSEHELVHDGNTHIRRKRK